MAAINDTAGIFVGETLDLFNQMEATVSGAADVIGAQQRLNATMQSILLDRETPPDPNDPTSESITPR